jgi:hypothetical protein
VDTKGKPQQFMYKFKNSDQKVVAYSMTSSSKTVKRDLLTETFDLELSYKYNSEKEVKKNIKTQANLLNTLHFVYDDGTFTQEEIPAIETVNENVTNTSDFEHIKPKVAPTGWVAGTVYSTTNGACDWKNQTLIFVSHFGKLMNLETGEISKEIIVAPGKKAHIAVPENTVAFLRVFRQNNTEKERISFWSLKNATHGWWYAVGCDDGNGLPNTCNDGHGKSGCQYLPH